MDHAARDVMNEFKDVLLAFGESDEYRLVLALNYYSASLFDARVFNHSFQLSISKIYSPVQSTGYKDSDNIDIAVHFFIRISLAEILSKSANDIPATVRWANNLIPWR
jgi:hypothetical protein